ncbi:MAG: FAD-binding oxidoreductase [Litoreibacter sp.]
MSSNTRRAFLLGTGAILGGWATRHYYTDPTPVGTKLVSPKIAGTMLNDASELSPTSVAKHITINEKIETLTIETLRSELAQARDANRPFIASAARHSMGGQSIARAGTTLTMAENWVEMDQNARTYRCGAGTRWSHVIQVLDANGYSPAVMQSNNDFGVASTYSVNAHGWPVPFSGCGSTVKSLQMMRADGDIITCSRDENADIFTAAMGGYGLFGIITELEMQMVPNTRLTPTFSDIDPSSFGTQFVQAINDNSGIQMAYGRMDISRDNFLERAMMITYRPSTDQSDLPAAGGSGMMSKAARHVFRAQLGSDIVKHRRWEFETKLVPMIANAPTTRNSLLNEPVVTLDDRDPSRTDILHEYFIAPERFAAFISACREVILSSYQELLNITLRYVLPDQESWLSYAPDGRIATVMLFSQEKSQRAEEDMARMTRTLIDRVITLGGSYYLPYRLHARQDQFERAYPGVRAFTAKKRAMDPKNLFRNALWDKYMIKV